MTLYTFTNISRNNSRLQISVLKNKNRTEECTFFFFYGEQVLLLQKLNNINLPFKI